MKSIKLRINYMKTDKANKRIKRSLEFTKKFPGGIKIVFMSDGLPRFTIRRKGRKKWVTY